MKCYLLDFAKLNKGIKACYVFLFNPLKIVSYKYGVI